ncbi:MAG: response regulator, partial [Pseudomonadota bacterium]|nr:response regulator [Pseudomonadota bacterium]
MPWPQTAVSEAPEISILLIEDAAGDAAAIIRALVFGETEYSFKVHRRSSLAEGLEFITHNKVDVILLDLGLPDAYNLTALTKVHAAAPELPVVVISGHSNLDTVHEALRQGAQ